MSLLLVLWLQCQLPSAAAFISTELAAVQTSLPLQPTTLDASSSASDQSKFVQSLLSCLPSTQPTVKQPDVSPEFSRYPDQITASSQPGAVTYEQRSGYYAIRLADPEAAPEGAVTVIKDEKGAIALFKGTPPTSLQRNGGDSPLPVYSDGDIAVVPTGEIFIRFQKGVDVRDRSAEIEAAGYSITQILDFAPQAAWIHASSGETADSLQRLAQLEGLVGIENIEPQLLMERQLR